MQQEAGGQLAEWAEAMNPCSLGQLPVIGDQIIKGFFYPQANRPQFLQGRDNAKRRVKKAASAAAKGQRSKRKLGDDVSLGTDNRVTGQCGGVPMWPAMSSMGCTLDA